jgi:glycosyltransferase involved in cell wall biosynthesis
MLKMLRGMLDLSYEVLVVYDNETDDSIAVVEAMRAESPFIRGILNSRGQGVVNAIRTGVDEARGQFVLIFAADELGPLIAIDDMVLLARQGCEFVSCTRYAHGGRRLGGTMIGGLLSRFANSLYHRVAGSVFTDSTTGIKLFRRDIFYSLDLEARPVGWAVAFEMAIKAELAGLRLGEVPIVSIDRLYGGESTFRVGPWLVEYLRWFLWGARQLRGSPNRSRSLRVLRQPASLRPAEEP